MPNVNLLSNMEEVFAAARAHTEDAGQASGPRPGAKQLVIVTPERNLFSIGFDPSRVSIDPVQNARSILRSEKPLHITVVAFTKFEDMTHEEADRLSMQATTKSIPFLGQLAAFAYAGHGVVVFEGHRSAFEQGVRSSDVLFVDSAMLPFLQEDWATTAFQVMNEGARIYVHDRATFSLRPVVRATDATGWKYTEPDDEASYANCLLTALARSKNLSIQIRAGLPLPDLAQVATDAHELEWITAVPFDYERLDAEQVMQVLIGASRRRLADIFRGSRTLKGMVVASGSEPIRVLFKLTQTRSNDGRRQLTVELR